jgi:hypothetical protein
MTAAKLKANIRFSFIWSSGSPETCSTMLNPERQRLWRAPVTCAVAWKEMKEWKGNKKT